MGSSFLQDILGDVDERTFLERNWGRCACPLPGVPGRFSSLFSWAVLSDILSSHRLGPPRLRLSVEGKQLPASEYLAFGRDHQGNVYSRVEPTRLSHALSQGATLVLDAVDELHAPVRHATRSLERIFRDPVSVNAYVGWSDKPGFGPHWDSHDVLVVQIAGEKQWRIFGAEPAARTRTNPGQAVPAEVSCSGLLRDGDALYIPRGWWHDAQMTGGPSMHLTFGVSNPTGLDYVKWLEAKLGALPLILADLPRFAPPEIRARHAGELRQAIIRALNSTMMEDFLAEHDQAFVPRSDVTLPHSIVGYDGFTDASLFRLLLLPPLDLTEQHDGSFSLRAGGQSWTVSAETAALIRLLGDGADWSLGRLRAALEERLQLSLLMPLLSELVAQGIVSCADNFVDRPADISLT
jgi:hypothetical protein